MQISMISADDVKSNYSPVEGKKAKAIRRKRPLPESNGRQGGHWREPSHRAERDDERKLGHRVDRIAPVLFRWKVGGIDVTDAPTLEGQTPVNAAEVENPEIRAAPEYATPRPGRRVHDGFLAQDVQAALAEYGIDFGGCRLDDKDDPGSRQWLRRD